MRLYMYKNKTYYIPIKLKFLNEPKSISLCELYSPYFSYIGLYTPVFLRKYLQKLV